ncbi:MAG: polysaccharide export protein [Alphaproteobacteria bacterium]|nr:polysaccharide export protein [Alphaproteobacteria bacterium]
MQQASGGSGLDYRLGAGDRLRVTVFGEPDLSGDFEVDSTGRLSMPLIGQVQATNTTISQVSKAIESLLSQGYLRDPKVSIDVLNYRPFFILGEVMKPGSYPYVNGLTVVNAVALAGGYTYRADKGDITIVRAGDTSKTEYKIDEVGEVMPGDVVRVPERFF